MRRLLLLTLLSGCAWVGPGAEEDFYDRDGDGVPWPEDCDDNDFSVQYCDSADTGPVYDGARRRHTDAGWRTVPVDPVLPNRN
ncbi:MAG: hypothetical protein KC912_05660 [Proteobacteria bacterium]|nr:hypothetical protein [Pseudomonadota bacterium]